MTKEEVKAEDKKDDKVISRVILKFEVDTKADSQKVLDFTGEMSKHIKTMKLPDGVKMFDLVGLEYDWSEKIYPKEKMPERLANYPKQDKQPVKTDDQETKYKKSMKQAEPQKEGKEFLKTDVGEWLK